MVILRETSPFFTLCAWDAIQTIVAQRQAPNLERLIKTLTRNYSYTEDEVQMEVSYMCKDKLLRPTKTVAVKGTKVGMEQMTYRLPSFKKLEPKGHHDWYCFKCHLPGQVFLCSECTLSYHESCLQGLSFTRNCNDYIICPLCTQINSESPKVKRAKLNKMLNFAFNRLKSKVIVLFKYYRCDDEEDWKMHYLIHSPSNISDLLNKLNKCRYSTMAEFQRDIMRIAHNSFIYQESKSPLAEIAQQLVDDCDYEILEMRQCRDCYLLSNEKPNEFWFAYPCRVPHQLVFAKQKGYPYWPAKVIRKCDGKSDVRFFGGSHERAIVEDIYVKPTTVDMRSLCLKKTSAWEKAYQELAKHKEQLQLAMNQPRDFFSDDELEEEERSNENDEEKDESYDIDELYENEIVKSVKKKMSNRKRGRPKAVIIPENEELVEECKEVEVKEEPVIKLEPKANKRSMTPKKENIPCKLRKKIKKSTESIENSEEVSSTVNVPKLAFVDAGIQVDLLSPKKDKSAEEGLAREVQALLRKISRLEKEHEKEVAMLKKKQWCRVCDSEAVYHCCWNTAYCSVECQQKHWQEEHRALCKRKR